MLRPSANTVERSAWPSPSVSVSWMILSLGISPGFRCGYDQVQATYIRPIASQRIVRGLATPSFSDANKFTANPSAGLNAFSSSPGELAGVGGGNSGCAATFGLAKPFATAATFSSAAAISTGSLSRSSRMLGMFFRLPMLNTRRLSSPNRHFQLAGRQ